MMLGSIYLGAGKMWRMWLGLGLWMGAKNEMDGWATNEYIVCDGR